MIQQGSFVRKSAIVFIMGGLLVPLLTCRAESPEADAPEVRLQTSEINDEDITEAIQSDLRFDEDAPSHLIDIETHQGVVTLSGSVDNILARERAVTIAESIRGVRSVVNMIEVNPIPRLDAEIREDVENALFMDPAADSYEILVTVENGVVTLKGDVDSWSEKRLAGYVAKGIRGVRELENQIDVDYSEDRSEPEIRSEVERRFEIDPLIHDSLINVQVRDETVILKGAVGSALERSRAYQKALLVAGVDAVDHSGLEVRWWARDELEKKRTVFKTDEEIEAAVRDAFLYDPRVLSFYIDVEADAGTVTLSGMVDNLKAKKAAAEDARNTTGVWKVENRIKVRPADPPPDKVIEQNVKGTLLRNPFVDRFDITVVVRNQKVYLYGRVDTRYEKTVAEDIASRTKGVVEVENNLEVTADWEWRSDTQIEKDIKHEFAWSLMVDGTDIDVSVQNGTAILEGEVTTIHELDAAIQNAFEGGARNVRNRLTITEAPEDYTDFYFRDYYYRRHMPFNRPL